MNELEMSTNRISFDVNSTGFTNASRYSKCVIVNDPDYEAMYHKEHDDFLGVTGVATLLFIFVLVLIYDKMNPNTKTKEDGE